MTPFYTPEEEKKKNKMEKRAKEFADDKIGSGHPLIWLHAHDFFKSGYKFALLDSIDAVEEVDPKDVASPQAMQVAATGVIRKLGGL